MALYVLQPGVQPLGQFDFLDADLPNVSGGQLGMFTETTSRANTATETAAYDVFDGYVADLIDAGTPTASRPVMRLADNGSGDRDAPHYLLDDGNEAAYGTLYGEVIGTPVGLATTGTRLGPHTALASGKVTAWHTAGVYAVTLDVLDTDVIPQSTGTGTDPNLWDTPLPGALLYRGDSTAQLTRTTTSTDRIATFIELSAGGGSLVTTPGRLVGAAEAFDRIVIYYLGATGSLLNA